MMTICIQIEDYIDKKRTDYLIGKKYVDNYRMKKL